jgi:uncharacterized protein YaiI (UPF0178 family)
LAIVKVLKQAENWVVELDTFEVEMLVVWMDIYMADNLVAYKAIMMVDEKEYYEVETMAEASAVAKVGLTVAGAVGMTAALKAF